MPIFFLKPPNHPRDLLSVEEAAQEAGTCEKTIRRWVSGNRLTAQQTDDRRWHIRRGDLEELLKSRANQAA